MGPPSAVSPLDVARAFGQRVAEKPIQEDMRKDPGLGSPGESALFVDTSTNAADDNMIFWMGLRGNLPTAQVSRMMDYRHRRGEFKDLPSDSWKRPDAVCHTGTAREYYEIKPLTDPGITAANEKFEKIDKFVSKFSLPYRRGERYMTTGERREKEIKIPAALKSLLNNLLTMFKLRNIRIFVVWERPMPAMIVYFFKVTVETDDERTKAAGAMQSLAMFALALAIQTEVPIANLVKPPSGKTTVEVPPELEDFKEAIQASAGAMVFDAVPGETHFLVIEEAGFQRIIERQRQLPSLLRLTGPMFNSEEWRRVLREDAIQRAETRDRLILMAGAVLLAGVAMYVCWPVIAAGAATATVAGGTAVAGTDVAVGTAGIRTGGIVVQGFLRGAAANDNAVLAAKAASIVLISTGYVLGTVKDAAAAQSIAKTGIMIPSDAAFDPTWLLRPNKTFGSGPKEFGATVDVSKFGVLRLPASPDDPPPSSRMRMIAKVTFS